MPFLLPTESELLLPVLKQREADWAGSTQLQPIKLKLPLKLVNDKKNCVSIYPTEEVMGISYCQKEKGKNRKRKKLLLLRDTL